MSTITCVWTYHLATFFYLSHPSLISIFLFSYFLLDSLYMHIFLLLYLHYWLISCTSCFIILKVLFITLNIHLPRALWKSHCAASCTTYSSQNVWLLRASCCWCSFVIVTSYSSYLNPSYMFTFRFNVQLSLQGILTRQQISFLPRTYQSLVLSGSLHTPKFSCGQGFHIPLV